MVTSNRADVCDVKRQENEDSRLLTLHERRGWKSESKGGRKMLSEIINGCFVFMVLVMLGCFAAGSSELASERDERNRTEKKIREKYGRTY